MLSLSLIDGTDESIQAAYHTALISTEFSYGNCNNILNNSRERLFILREGNDALLKIGTGLDLRASWEIDKLFEQAVGKFMHLFSDEMYDDFDVLWECFHEKSEFLRVFGSEITSEDLLVWANLLTEVALVQKARPVSSNRMVIDCVDTTLFLNQVKSSELATRINASASSMLPFLVVWPRLSFETPEQLLEIREKHAISLSFFRNTLLEWLKVIGKPGILTRIESEDNVMYITRSLQSKADCLFRSLQASRDKSTVHLIEKSSEIYSSVDFKTYNRFELPVMFLICGVSFMEDIAKTKGNYTSSESEHDKEHLPGSCFFFDLSMEGFRLWSQLCKAINL